MYVYDVYMSWVKVEVDTGKIGYTTLSPDLPKSWPYTIS